MLLMCIHHVELRNPESVKGVELLKIRWRDEGRRNKQRFSFILTNNKNIK